MWGGRIVTRYEDIRRCVQDDEHLSVEMEADRLRNASLDISRTQTAVSDVDHLPRPTGPHETPAHRRCGVQPRDGRQPASSGFGGDPVAVDDTDRQAPGETEFSENSAHSPPVHVRGKFVELPLEDGENLGDWSKNIELTLFHCYRTENRRKRNEGSIEEFADSLRGGVRRRRENERADMIAYVDQIEADGETLTEDDVVATAVRLLFAGHETTTLLANGVLEPLHRPEQMPMLREDPSLTPSAVEEILSGDIQVAHPRRHQGLPAAGQAVRGRRVHPVESGRCHP
jgi:hypothetical protein